MDAREAACREYGLPTWIAPGLSDPFEAAIIQRLLTVKPTTHSYHARGQAYDLFVPGHGTVHLTPADVSLKQSEPLI